MMSVTIYTSGPESPRRASIIGTGSDGSGVARSTVVVVFDTVSSLWYFWRASINTLTNFCTGVDGDVVFVSTLDPEA